jgi:hypothetical protein
MTTLDDRIKNIEKYRGNIAKLGKAESADRTKADAMKEVDSLLKEAKPMAKTRADLEKRIKDAKKLADDVKKFRDDFTKIINSAQKTASKVGACNPDTKARDYFNLSQHLTLIGQVDTLDMPGE